jgi:hypothetical protein
LGDRSARRPAQGRRGVGFYEREEEELIPSRFALARRSTLVGFSSRGLATFVYLGGDSATLEIVIARFLSIDGLCATRLFRIYALECYHPAFRR